MSLSRLTQFNFFTLGAMAIAALALMLGLGCATKEINQQIDADIQQQPPVKGPHQLNERIENVISQAQNLTPDQKAKLLQLHETNLTEMQSLNQQSLQLRELLAKSITDPDYKDQQVVGVKKRLKKVEQQKLAMIFASVDKANTILGHRSRDNAAVMRAMEIDDWEIHEPSVGRR